MKRLRLSTATDRFQLVEALLTNRKQRQRQHRFVVQGVRNISLAVESGWRLDSLLYEIGRPLSSWAQELLDRDLASVGYELSRPLMERLSEKEDVAELVAVVELPRDDVERIPLREDGIVLVLDRPNLPGNVGSIVRSADAMGADGVIVTGHAADPYDPQSVRASMGSLFTVPIVRAPSPAAVGDRLRTHSVQIVGTSAHGQLTVDQVDLGPATALVIGNETTGLSEFWHDASDAVVRIPMHGAATSLNAAAAAAILLYETRRQRQAR